MATPLRDRGSAGHGPGSLTLAEVFAYEGSEWTKGVRALFWHQDARVPEEWRGDGLFDSRAVLSMEADEARAWAAERAGWEAQRLQWLEEAAHDEGTSTLTENP